MLVQSLIIEAAVLGTGAALLDTDTELLAGPAERAPAQLNPAEHVLKQKLDAAMADAVYREPGLAIGTLADRLGTPEHRLRALINRRLGYRNFSAFLNAHRIAEAQALLADPAKVDLPVLTIAMDLGYGSLAPFNRAFREATAQTPTDFRRAAIVGPEKS
jgi:AraC-like DNA-binding protein